jgi:ribose 5-phosphate isomerase B
MKIGIGADHRGYHIKEFLKKELKNLNIEVIDLGTFSEDSVDYPDFALKLGEKIKNRELDMGILICMTGIGMQIAANKVRGVRAALCREEEDAYFARAHNDANVLALGAKDMEDKEKLWKIVKKFIETPFEGGRHERRIKKIESYENNSSGC